MLVWLKAILVHMEGTGGKQSKMNGANDEGSGHGRQRVAAGTQPAEQALQADTASGLSARHRPQHKRPQMAGLAAKQQLQTNVGLPLAVQCR